MKKLLMGILVILGIAFLGLAVYYWKTPAGSLPHLLPGYQAGLTRAHTKHALVAFILAVGCGILAWFLSGGDKPAPISPESTPKA